MHRRTSWESKGRGRPSGHTYILQVSLPDTLSWTPTWQRGTCTFWGGLLDKLIRGTKQDDGQRVDKDPVRVEKDKVPPYKGFKFFKGAALFQSLLMLLSMLYFDFLFFLPPPCQNFLFKTGKDWGFRP